MLRFEKQLFSLIIPILLFLGLSCFYYWFIDWGDMSMLKTLNGVWKALKYTDYRSGGSIEEGGVLYFALIDLVAQTFSFSSPIAYYKAFLILNGVFSALLHAALFQFSFSISQSGRISLLVTLIHFLFTGNFLLSINNEDIYPSYALYVVHFIYVYKYVSTQRFIYAVVACLFGCLSLLLHWTTGLIALVVFFPFLFWLNRKKRHFEPLLIVLIPAAVVGIVSLTLDYPFSKILYPGKGDNTLWIGGFDFESACLVLINSVGYYFSFGTTYLWGDISFWRLFQVALAVPVLIYPMKTVFRHIKAHREVLNNSKFKMLGYAVSVFVVASLMNAYEQGNDLQFFIQPAFTFTYILLVFSMLKLDGANWRRNYFRTVLGVLVFMNSFYVLAQLGYNSRKEWAGIDMLENNLYDLNRTLFISGSFHPSIPLLMLRRGGFSEVDYMFFPDASKSGIEQTNVRYVKDVTESICDFVEDGYQLVAIKFIDEPAELHGKSFIGYDMTEKIQLVQHFLTERFEVADSISVDGTKHQYYVLKPKLNTCK